MKHFFDLSRSPILAFIARLWRWRKKTQSEDYAWLYQEKLFDYDEAFVSPCTLNEVNVGGLHGKWTPKIMLMGGPLPEGD